MIGALVALALVGAPAPTSPEDPVDRVSRICEQAARTDRMFEKRSRTEAELDLEGEAYVGRLEMVLDEHEIEPNDRVAWKLMCGVYLRGQMIVINKVVAMLDRAE